MVELRWLVSIWYLPFNCKLLEGKNLVFPHLYMPYSLLPQHKQGLIQNDYWLNEYYTEFHERLESKFRRKVKGEVLV